MKRLRFALFAATIGSALALAASAETRAGPDHVSLHTLSAFQDPGENWTLASGIGGDPRHKAELEPLPGVGAIVNTASKGSGSNLFSAWEHGDVELELEFLMSAGSNSGIYLQSRYEVQLFDSWGVDSPEYSDCGGIYQRGPKDQGYGGTAPRLNASRAPGLWQRLRISFLAPRFDESGKKIENARFVEVSLNGFVIHENVEVTGPTRAAAHDDETARGPLMLQGDHGPVAFRNISVKHLTSDRVSLSDIAYELRPGEGLQIGNYDDIEPTATASVSEILPTDLAEANNFAVTYQGRIHVPITGTYSFLATGMGPIQLIIDEETAVIPLSPGGRGVPVELKAGAHGFRLDYTHGQWGRPGLNLSVDGPGLRRQALTPLEKEITGEPSARELIIEPFDDRVRVQRGFIPYDPRKRLYAIAVGSPASVHYAYDFDMASLLHVWSGPFLDASEFWIERAQNQIVKPLGPTLTLRAKPVVTLLESTDHDWPDQPDELWSPQGYRLDPDGQPEFLAHLADLDIRDRIVVTQPQRGLERTIEIEGEHTSWWTGVLLAEASSITVQSDGNSYIIGDRSYYIDVAPGSKPQPFVRTLNGHDQLIVWVPKSKGGTTVNYTLVW